MKSTFDVISRLASVKGVAAIFLAFGALLLPACGVEEEGVYEEEGIYEEEGVLEEEEGVLEEEEGVLEEEDGVLEED